MTNIEHKAFCILYWLSINSKKNNSLKCILLIVSLIDSRVTYKEYNSYKTIKILPQIICSGYSLRKA